MALRANVRFLARDIWDAPDDHKMYEVIDGALFISPRPGMRHQFAAGTLLALIGAYVRGHRLGTVLPPLTAVVLDEFTAVQPDCLYVSSKRSDLISERGIEGAPDLVVEVRSPSTAARDRGIKMRRYAAAGVRHYWIVGPVNRTLEAYELGESGYGQPDVCGSGSVFRPALFPGLEIPIDALWE